LVVTIEPDYNRYYNLGKRSAIARSARQQKKAHKSGINPPRLKVLSGSLR
jgi:hypothetical protein